MPLLLFAFHDAAPHAHVRAICKLINDIHAITSSPAVFSLAAIGQLCQRFSLARFKGMQLHRLPFDVGRGDRKGPILAVSCLVYPFVHKEDGSALVYRQCCLNY